MLAIEKKIYSFIGKYLHFIVSLVVICVVLFMNRQVLYCVRPYEGADMWEASEVFMHSPLYVLFLRKIWIELFSANNELYYKFFWIFSYCTAFLCAAMYHLYQKKMSVSPSLVKTSIFFCVGLITPLTLLYGPVMLHTDGISISLILLSILLGNFLPATIRRVLYAFVFAFVIAFQSNYAFVAIALIIYGFVKKNRICIYIPLVSVIFSVIVNVLVGVSLDFSVKESIYMFSRFFYISQETGTCFSSVFSWILYMIFWNGYWMGMFFLFRAFVIPKKAPMYALLHIILFFYSVTIFFNGYL